MLNSKKNPIIFGTLLLSFSGLLCRGIGFFYRFFISHAFGEEAMGIFQLTSPVLMLAFSLTCAGMQTAISRYTASCFAQKNPLLAQKYLRYGCAISTILSLLYSLAIYLYAENISIYFLQEKRCATLLRICSFSFPFAALHSCFNGYFYGRKETKIPSFTQITEQLLRVGTVLFLYYFFTTQGKTPSIALTCVGMLCGETVSFFISYFCYLIFFKYDSTFSGPVLVCPRIFSHSTRFSKQIKYNPTTKSTLDSISILRHLLSLSLPLTISRVIVNLLQSYEAISISVSLRAFGYSAKTSLIIYGVLTGMAMSLVLFPSTFINSASVLLLPSVSEADSGKNSAQIKKTIKQAIFFSCILGFSCTIFFFSFGGICGKLLFNSILAGKFIKQLSFLCPFLYLHTTLSSILNGLKKTGITLFINLLSISIRLYFALFVISSYGIEGYLWGLLLSELISSFLCIYFLKSHMFNA